MKRSQQKAQLKNKKARQKEARRAKQEAAPVAVAAKEVVEQPAPEIADTVKEAKATVAEARAQVRQADEVDSATARGMLVRAARMLDKVVTMAHRTLDELPEKKVREAFDVATAKPEPSEVRAEKRPRRGADPLVTLIKIGLSAVSLLRRVLAKTNPELGKLARV